MLVLTQPKTFVVSAEGGASVGDSVIIASTSCEDESAANRLVFPVVASGESLQTTVTVGVEDIEPSTPRAWFLFYRFVHEKPAVTSILMEVDGFTSAEALTVSVGDKLKAVVKKEKQYAFATAQGARAGDRVALGCSCESLLTPMEELNASATATLVLATKPTCAVGVCYKFREEPEVFYSWAMTAYELSSLNGQSAFTKDVVSGERYVFSFEGSSSTEDEFKLVAADADCAATLHDYSDSFGAVLPDIAVEGAMDSEDGSYTILRLGGSGDLTAYFPSMQASMVNGKWTGLNAILVDGVYAYIQKYEPSARFLHLTEKIAVEAGATLKLVHATEMEVVASLNAYRANVTLPLTTTSEGLLKLCYAFAGDAFFAYDEYQFRVRQVSPSTLSVSGTPGHTLLKAMKNVVALAGLNLESGDKLLLVQPTERCSAVPAAEVTMTVEDGVASVVVDASLEGSYRLCYKFGEIGIQNTAAVVDVVGASVTGQTSEYNAWFSVANQAHAITYTTPKSEAFEQERVPYFATMANSGYHVTGVLDSLMKPEGELILYATSAANAVFTFSTAHAADVLSRVEQFVVTIENHQLSAVTLEVTLKTGASSMMKTVTELVDGVNRVVFDASVAGWSALTFSAPVSYTIKVSSSSISIFNFQRTYSTLVFAVEGAESLKYVREACSEEPVASAVMAVGEDRTVRWLFTEGSATEQWKLCYAIGASGFVGAGVEFTPEGKEFLGYAVSLLEQKQRIESLYGESRSTIAPVHFSVSTQRYPFTEDAFLEMLQQNQENRYQYTLKETSMDGVIDDVYDHRADIGVIFLTKLTEKIVCRLLDGRELTFHELAAVPPCVYVRKGHPLTQLEHVSEADLEGYPYSSFEQAQGVAVDFSEELPMVSMRKPSKAIIVNNRSTAMNVLANTDAYSTGSGLLAEHLSPANVVTIPLADKDPVRLGWIYPQNAKLSSHAEEFVRLLEQSIQRSIAYTSSLHRQIVGK